MIIIIIRCKGDEYNLSACPHEGLQEATYCQDHKDDEGVFCYTSGKCGAAMGLLPAVAYDAKTYIIYFGLKKIVM